MRVPRMQFTTAGDVNIAYQVVGDGPVDLVWAWGLASSIEVAWDDPSYAAFLRRLSEFSRVILYDRRGCGASDREGTAGTPTLEERVEDILAVLDAVGSTKASIFGVSEGGVVAAWFAATHPERTDKVIIYGTMARFLKDADHPWGWNDQNALAAFYELLRQGWGTIEGAQMGVPLWAPSMVGDERFTEWMAKHARQSVSRSAVLPLMKSFEAHDLIDVFPAVRVPALVVHRRDDPLVPVSHGRWIAEHMPDARYVELPGIDHLPFIGDVEEILGEIERFLVGSDQPAPGHRRLLTLMFTDLVESTRRVEGLGDEAWRELLAAHDETLRSHLARFSGTEVKHLGDGFLATFDGPARAIRCAMGILDGTNRLGLAARVGVHTGECEVVGDDVRGIAVHITARLVEQAGPAEVLVSATVRDLVAGSGIRFGEPRHVELKGVTGSRDVFPVLTHGTPPETVRRLAIESASVLRCDGEYWTIAYDGQVATVRDTKGLRDVARLLAVPQQELHVLDLAAERDPEGVLAARARPDDGLAVERRRYEPVIDEAARADYRRRLAELDEEIDDADARGDGDGSAKAKAERDALVDELTRAYGLGGTIRRSPDHVERARKAVTRRIRATVSRIERVHPTLGRHLRAFVHTGVFCSYQPERHAVWTIELTRPSSNAP
jgi:pimeloyl-ACP methyl ester carboxylesterase/class 3 adenylate cyclase